MADLRDLQRDFDSVATLLRGLEAHYQTALATGRMEQWKKVAHGIIDLVGNDIAVVRRAGLECGNDINRSQTS